MLGIMPSRHRLNRIRIAPYLFTLPFVVSFIIFFIYPLGYMIVMSFQNIEGISSATFVGLKNYLRLITDNRVTASMLNSIYFTLGILVINITIPLFLAIVLNNRFTLFRNAFRSALYLPALTSIIVAGIFFRLFFSSNENTPLNRIIQLFGQEPKAWLFDSVPLGIFALIITSTWRWLGTNIIYFLCGLQSIPPDLYEAADIDGANSFQRLRYVTLPSLRPIIIFVVTILTYGGLRMFGESYVLWVSGTGNTPGNIGLTIVLYIYRTAFTRFQVGYAAAMSTALFFLLILINLAYIKVLRIGKGV
ncbi:MAG: carbohydrate ABC transporter permease [Christensenellales bacterium]|jgi:arabinosaccharide transport system permease protein